MRSMGSFWYGKEMRLTLAMFFNFFLMGCAVTDAYWEELKHTSSLRYFISDESKLERYKEKCETLGFKPEDSNWEECLLSVAEIDSRAASARREANKVNSDSGSGYGSISCAKNVQNC